MAKRDPVEDLVQAVRRAVPRLPDIDRARGAAKLVERLARETQPRAPATARRGRAGPLLWTALGAAAAATALLAWFGVRPPPMVTAPQPPLAPTKSGDRPLPPAPVVPLEERALLHTANAHRQAHLEAEPGEIVRAALANSGRLALRNAGRLSVAESSPTGIVLELERGTLLVSYDRDSGRDLAVRTHDALVRVTGTVFAVETGDGPTRVSVLRGSVQVETTGLPIAVAAGKRWQVGAKGLSQPQAAITLALRELRATHEGRPAPTRVAPTVEHKRTATPAPAEAPPGSPPARPDGEDDAELLYRQAEQALAAGQAATAKTRLLALIARHPASALVGPATYELGRLEFAARDFASARARFVTLHAGDQAGAAPFREPAAFLVCRSEQELGKRAAAITCLERYRRDFPGSPHDDDALATLALLHLAAGDCTRALPLAEEYLAHHPNGEQAAALRSAQERCQD